MNILPAQLVTTNFKSDVKHNNSIMREHAQEEENPISRKGEAAKLAKATFIGGLALAGKLLWEIFVDGDFLIEDVAKKAGKIIDKNKKEAAENKKLLYKIGAFFAILAAGVSGFALLYTACNAPKIAYKSKVNTFKNQKEMDVYIKSNKAEKEIYTQLADEAKNADSQKREQLKEQYTKMALAKNQLPKLV